MYDWNHSKYVPGNFKKRNNLQDRNTFLFAMKQLCVGGWTRGGVVALWHHGSGAFLPFWSRFPEVSLPGSRLLSSRGLTVQDGSQSAWQKGQLLPSHTQFG